MKTISPTSKRPATRLACAVLVITSVSWAVRAPAADDAKSSLDRAMQYLAASQNADGGYGPFGKAARVKNASDVGITGFVIYAMACHPRRYAAVDGPFLSRAVDYLLSHQQPDGGFYDPRDPALLNYRTSVAMMALVRLDRVMYADAIRKAQKFILAQQRDEKGNYLKSDHLSYGSVGHSGAIRGDLSNAAYAAEAMHESGLSVSEPFWKRLEVFVTRCQNVPKVDPLLKRSGIGTTSDYGFRYAPNDTRGPRESLDDGSTAYSSYGSMTYQGLKSLLYARVSRDDPRVKEAFRWISKRFSVRENPGMASPKNPRAGLQGLFYYYHTMAKTLSVYGEAEIVDGKGVRHDWAAELSAHLVAMQKADGHWVNSTGRWWEDLPTLDTAYAMITLGICYEETLKRKSADKAPTATEEKPAEKSADTPPAGK